MFWSTDFSYVNTTEVHIKFNWKHKTKTSDHCYNWAIEEQIERKHAELIEPFM